MRDRLAAIVAAFVFGLIVAVPRPLSLPSLLPLLACLTVLAAPAWTGCLGLGLRGDNPPIERGAP
jgi:hypothetical protein